MIIACPDCSGPFEIPDDRIAALVQIECPHCRFRMILDFAAANDPSLVEAGMRMASGYRSAADYRAAAAEPAIRPAPPPPMEEVTTRQEPTLRPVPTQAEPPAAVTHGRRERAARAIQPPFETIPTESPRAADTRPPTHAARPEPRPQLRTPVSPQPEPEPEAPTSTARGDTQIGPPPGEFAASYDEDAPTRVHSAEAIVSRPPAEPVRRDVTVVAQAPSSSARMRRDGSWTEPAAPARAQEARAPTPMPEEAETRPEAELPVTPHRPAVEMAPPRAAAAFGDELDAGGDFDEFEPMKKGGVFGTVVVTMLLLAALGLVGASLALKNTPDPRPLLEQLIRN